MRLFHQNHQKKFLGLSLNRGKGFTLVELMITLAVLAVVLTLAMPSMRSFIVRNRISAIANEFLGTLNLIRSEAITRQARVTICQSDAPNATPLRCSNNKADWNLGWIAFVEDSQYSGDPSASNATILKVRGALGEGYTLISPTSGALSFGATGKLLGTGAGTSFTISPVEATVEWQRTICVARTGRARMQDGVGCS